MSEKSNDASSSTTKGQKSILQKPANLECKDLHSYLKSRSSDVLERLYDYPTICLAVYRELPEIARQFVIRILFVEQPVPQAVIASWSSQVFAKYKYNFCIV